MPSFVKLGQVFQPAPGEHLLSWLMRLCDANGIVLSDFAEQLVDIKASEFASIASRTEHSLVISCLTDTSEDIIREMMHLDLSAEITTFGGQSIPSSALERSKRRFAPGHLSRDRTPFLRALWAIRPITCDPTSGERLVDRCPCGHPFWWRDAHELLNCTACRADIRSIPSTQGTDNEIEASRFWASLYSMKASRREEVRDSLAPVFKNWTAVELVRLIEIARRVMGASDLTTGILLLKDWPKSVSSLHAPKRAALMRAVAELSREAAN
ncbi:TniQ family protein [Bradyrhizobium sp. CNPSo 4010]|uniref:TniQ family protein n=1 Tax=Bradyrhizobium agreste TaxID=2751811 RepID=A0ABS0PJ77_9BRAD|nr:TniQ family protein [Bradyrhizobium agreste]MBH5397257.1 TniQ family protein [Bradyrhizobium agreste]